jgi:multidrug efflux pump subunit AcrB
MSGSLGKGAIAWMAQNPVASNLLMVLILAGGVLGLFSTKQEVFPTFSLDMIAVSVPYPGASPAEVEQGIVLAVEDALTGIEGIKRTTSTSAEGSGSVIVELLNGANPDQVLSDVKSAVDRIRSFPEEAEDPNVALASQRSHVVSLVLSGDQDRRTLHALAEKGRADLLAIDGITQVEVEGVPPLELAIEVSREKLESFGLSSADVSRAIAMASLELPGGQIETRSGQILVRVADRRTEGFEFGDIILRGTAQGGVVRLSDVATITDGFEDTDQAGYFNGATAVQLEVFRTGDETPSGVARLSREYAEELRGQVPDGISVDIWDDDSIVLEARMSLLTRNARWGLLLVVAILAMFLDLRLAFWVSLGIPISYFGTLFLMPVMGVSINMITLFAFIVTLGLVVDDAIVVGEAAYAHMEAGMSRLEASIAGAKEMAVPVTFAILTSVAAFSPLLFVPGIMGKVFIFIPLVVITILLFSLVESFFILPAHLGHGSAAATKGTRLNRWTQAKLDIFVERIYRPFLYRAMAARYLVLSVAVALFAITIGLVASGRVPFNFFPRIEMDVVTASVRLPYGSPVEQTERVRVSLEEAADRALESLGGDDDVVMGTYTLVGEAPGGRFGPGETGGHLLTIQLELVPRDEREFGARQFATAWREHVPPMAGIEAMTFGGSGGPHAGSDIGVQLSHDDPKMLADASRELAITLGGYSELMNIDNTFKPGKEQLDFHLKPEAMTLGVTASTLAVQLRGSLYGAEALREQRGRNELKVMVRLPESQRSSEWDLEMMQIRTPAGAFVPLKTVADYERSRAPTSINREEGRRVIDVSADLKPGVDSAREVRDDLEESVIPALVAKYPGLDWSSVGAAREQKESMKALGKGYLLALIAIYALLAIPFRSYVQPLIVMSAIPFGLVGAVVGHMLMGYELSVMSFFGIIALSGVVVNDSLVLIDATNRFREAGANATDAIVGGAVRRLRPIILTSLTTFFGLAPMLLETDVQARFLIPMAISLGCGVLFGTFVILILVPALYMIVEDARGRRSEEQPAAMPMGEPLTA